MHYFLLLGMFFLVPLQSDGYATDSQGYLYRLDAKNHSLQKLGKIRVALKKGPLYPVLTDLAFAPDGKLYGISFSSLYLIDRHNPAVSTLIGSFTYTLNSAAFDHQGILYAAGNNSLYKVDLKTAALTKVGITQAAWSSDGDLAFVAGKMYGTFRVYDGGGLGSMLAQINLKTGKATAIGLVQDHAHVRVTNIWGLVYDLDGKKEQLWGLTSGGKAVLIDLKTAKVSKKFSTNVSFWGGCLKFDF